MFEPLKTPVKDILNLYDVHDPKLSGKPLYFDMDLHISNIYQFISSDEIQMAISMCDSVPGYYRDNPDERLEQIKNILYKNCYDQFDYASDYDEANYSLDAIKAQCLSHYTYPRADILFNDIKELNANGQTPFIFEISPSHGWLPIGFHSRGVKFNFFGKNLNQQALKKIKDYFEEQGDDTWREMPKTNQPTVLVCFEALEHMWNPHDLEQAAKKTGFDYDCIYLSTPKYTLGGGLPNWQTRRLGHVRTWTPKEFIEFAQKSFHGYNWSYYDSYSMVLKGTKLEPRYFTNSNNNSEYVPREDKAVSGHLY